MRSVTIVTLILTALIFSFLAPISYLEVRSVNYTDVQDPVLDSPANNTTLQAGESYEIQWHSTSDTITLWYSIESGEGKSWVLIERQIRSDTNSYDWVVPDTPTTLDEGRGSGALRIVNDDTGNSDTNTGIIILSSSTNPDHEFNCSDFNGMAGPFWSSGEYVYGDITQYPVGIDQFWIATVEQTSGNPPSDGDWFGPCTCSEIWASADRNDDGVLDENIWDSTITYNRYTIVLHNNSYFFANIDGTRGDTPDAPSSSTSSGFWNSTCETPHPCDEIRGQDIDWWSSTIAGLSPQKGPGYSKGDVAVSYGGGSFVPNVWVSNVDQNHALPTGSSTTWQTGWDITVVDPGPMVGNWPGIGLDSNDNVHIAYYDGLNYSLKYAVHDGVSWTISWIDNDAGSYSALVVDSADHVHVAYSDSVNKKMKYAYYDGASWATTVVADAVPDKGNINGQGGAYDTSFSIAVDSNNNPHISYFNRYPGGVWALSAEILYSTFDGTTWTTMSVDSSYVHQTGGFSDIAVDSSGGIHITWAGLGPGGSGWGVRYAYYDGFSWTKSMVKKLAVYPSIALDSNDNPRIAYGTIWGTRALYEATIVQGAWQSNFIASGYSYSTSTHNSIFIDDNDRSHIVSTLNRKYSGMSQPTYGLHYSWDPTGMATLGGVYASLYPWSTEVIDMKGYAKYSDLTLDSNGIPHVAYYDDFNGGHHLRYATASLTQGNNWTKCNCSDLSSEPWDSGFASNWQTTGGYDALSVVLHYGLHWMSFSDNNGLEPGSPNSGWYLCIDDATPCEDVKKTGDMWNRHTLYAIDGIVEHPVNSGNYWVSLQDDNMFEPSNTQTQWWWHCSCEELSLGTWADATDFEEREVVEWNGAYWTALMDHTSSTSISPGFSSDRLYWKKCRADACTTSGWWNSGAAISGMYDTGVVVSHPEPDGWRWISLIDDNFDYPANSDYWIRCNITEGLVAEPPPDQSLVGINIPSVGIVEVTERDAAVAGGTVVGSSVLWLVGRRLLGSPA